MIDIKQIKFISKLFGALAVALAVAALLSKSNIVAVCTFSAIIVTAALWVVLAIDFFVERSLKKGGSDLKQ